MEYVRCFDRAALDPTKFDFLTLADLETVWVVPVQVPVGYEGNAPHVHDSDQLYYVLDGELTVELDGVEHVATAESLVFIPAGTPHANRNRGAVPELHLDLLVPPPSRFGSVARPPGTGFVRALGDDYDPSHIPGFDMKRMAGPADGSHGVLINAARVDESSAGTSWHIHAFDQLYWVTEGTLHVEVADQIHDVAPGYLVVLPAGVPHRNWNPGPGPERHVALIAPAPTARPFDTAVTWEVGQPVG
jgi:mannose-6-phosphate isomerase-like protein (cupin superfamily)